MYTGFQLIPVRQRRTPKNTSLENLSVGYGYPKTINGHEITLLATTPKYRRLVRREEYWKIRARENAHNRLVREFGKGIGYAQQRFPEAYETIIELFEAAQP